MDVKSMDSESSPRNVHIALPPPNLPVRRVPSHGPPHQRRETDRFDEVCPCADTPSFVVAVYSSPPPEGFLFLEKLRQMRYYCLLGSVAERSNAAHLKCAIRETVSEVRILPLPPVITVRWLSGLKQRIRNAPYWKPYRGFDSHPHRQLGNEAL